MVLLGVYIGTAVTMIHPVDMILILTLIFG